ncbi:MAG: hypothetical protein F4X02_14915 [Chloroflexi bacterium]|nr:hypothetical protein [Chloroflexota bacterium]
MTNIERSEPGGQKAEMRLAAIRHSAWIGQPAPKTDKDRAELLAEARQATGKTLYQLLRAIAIEAARAGRLGLALPIDRPEYWRETGVFIGFEYWILRHDCNGDISARYGFADNWRRLLTKAALDRLAEH